MRIFKWYGPPGCGKTHKLLTLFEQELKGGTRPDKIAFLTFTRAARDEARGRVDLPLAELTWLRTIHSACYRALGVTRAEMLTAKAVQRFGREVGVELTGNVNDPWSSLDALDEPGQAWGAAQDPGDRVLQAYHLARHRGVPLAETLARDVELRYGQWLVDSYDAWRRREGLMDYTDLIADYVRAGQPLDVTAAIVDEAQDLSWLQWRAVHRMFARAESLVVAGDDDQAIFTWAGASAAYLNELKVDETAVLPRSQRVPRCVLALANEVARHIPDRWPKAFEPRDADGEVKRIGFNLAAADVAGGAFVLFRNRYRAPALAAQLEELGVPFAGASAVLSNEAVGPALAGWAELAAGHLATHEQAAAIIHQTSKEWLAPGAAEAVRDRGMVPWERVLLRQPTEANWLEAMSHLPRQGYLTRLQRTRQLKELISPTVKLMSIHQAKGREHATVILDPSLARRSADGVWASEGDEHRVWYVAVTRARERLVIMETAESHRYEL